MKILSGIGSTGDVLYQTMVFSFVEINYFLTNVGLANKEGQMKSERDVLFEYLGGIEVSSESKVKHWLETQLMDTVDKGN